MDRVPMEATPAQEGNLGDRAQSGRLRFGVIAFGVAMVGAVVALETAAPRWVLGLLFLPFFVGAFGVLQGLLKTCPGLAMQGMRDTGDGPERVIDREALKKARAVALRVM